VPHKTNKTTTTTTTKHIHTNMWRRYMGICVRDGERGWL